MSMHKQRYYLQGLGRALSLLEVLKDGGSCSLTAIAEQLHFDKTTVYRMLSTFAKHGWVRQDPESRKYELGLKPIEYAYGVLSGLRIRKEARPFLAHLQEVTGETAMLALIENYRIVCVDLVESHASLRFQLEIGETVLPHCTALGKAIIAHVPKQDLPHIVGDEPFPRFTPNTITDYEQLDRELEQIRRRGFAVDNHEFVEGATCIGAAVYDYTGSVVGGVSISAPSARVSTARLHQFGEQLVEAASTISSYLGYCEDT